MDKHDYSPEGRKTSFPVPYTKWTCSASCPAIILSVGRAVCREEECEAYPIDKHKLNSPWHVRPKSLKLDVAGLTGPSEYVGHAGAYSGGANGVFWVRILDPSATASLSRMSRRRASADFETVETTLEPDLLYPLIRWSECLRYAATPSVYVILARDPRPAQASSKNALRRDYPQTYQYLKGFEKTLHSTRQQFDSDIDGIGPFYSMFAVGTYTLAPTKVVWRRMDRRITAAVVEEIDDPHLGKRPAIPQETCVLIDGGLPQASACRRHPQ